MMAGIGIIAGHGGLPAILADGLRRAGQTVQIIDFHGQEVDWAGDLPRFTGYFEAPEAIFAALAASGCDRIVMAGSMSRPKLDPTRFDPTFTRFAPALMQALPKGDNAALSVVIEMLASGGFEIVGAADAMPDLVATAGPLGALRPETQDLADLARGMEILRATSALDIGQSVVVSGGLCVGFETLQGTQAMLEFVGARAASLPEGGVLVKMPKVGQDLRVDMPAVGPDTITQAVQARLSGIAIKAGQVLVLEREALCAAADAAGLFVWAFE